MDKPENKRRGSLSTDPKVQRSKGIKRVTLTYDKDNMMCYFYIEKDAILEMHTHPQSQIGIVIKGVIDFTKGDGEVLHLKAGDSYYFASMEPHGLKSFEEVELLECFAPSRPEYID